MQTLNIKRCKRIPFQLICGIHHPLESYIPTKKNVVNGYANFVINVVRGIETIDQRSNHSYTSNAEQITYHWKLCHIGI